MGRGKIILLVVVGVLIVAMFVTVFVAAKSKGTTSGDGTPSAGVPTASVTASLTSAPTSVSATRVATAAPSRFDPSLPWDQYNAAWQNSQHDLVLVKDVAPGIDRCASRLTGVATEETYGYGTSFPETLEGAVAFSAAVLEYRFGNSYLIDAQRQVMEPLLFEPWLQVTDLSDQNKAAHQTDGNGNVVDADGNILTQDMLLFSGHPEYGAYKILALQTDGFNGQPVTDLYIQWWLPSVKGTGNDNDLSKVYTSFMIFQEAILWDEKAGGWRVYLITVSTWSPRPQDQSYINHSFAERAQIVGPDTGWCVAADATEDWRSPVPMVRKS